MLILEPYLRNLAEENKYVLTDKGPLSYELQKSVGDALYNSGDGKVWGVEFKIEETYTGNFFLETWSNKKFGMANPGWMVTLRTDRLWYYFLNTDQLFVIDFEKLFEWAFGNSSSTGNIYDYREAKQYKHQQKNITCGRIVPVYVIGQEVGFIKECNPKAELSLQPSELWPL